jgi:hypothetical protein
MTLAQFSREIRRQPFRPFRLLLADGRAVLVSHPNAMAWSELGQTIAVIGEQGTAVFNLGQITELVAEPGGGGTGFTKTLDDAYRALHTAEQAGPSRPFKLLLAGGWVVPVTDPDRIAFEPGYWEAVVLESGGQREICLQRLVRLRLGGAEPGVGAEGGGR